MKTRTLASVVACLTFAVVVASTATAARAADLRLPEGANGSALAVGLSRLAPRADMCVWTETGKGIRVFVGKTLMPGRMACDAKVVGAAIAGRTRASRTLMFDAQSGTTMAQDTYGEAGAFFGPGEREFATGLGEPLTGLWPDLTAANVVVVLPGGIYKPADVPRDPTCSDVKAFTTEELVATLQTARPDMEHCWLKHAGGSAFTFEVVSGRDGKVLPKLIASAKPEPKVSTCLRAALAVVQFDAERARCHQVRTQWPVVSPGR